MLPAEQTADHAHQQRVDRKERDIAAAARPRLVASPRDVLVVAAVVARERIPERARRPEYRELLALVEWKREIDEQRQEGRNDPDAQRTGGDLQGNAPPVRRLVERRQRLRLSFAQITEDAEQGSLLSHQPRFGLTSALDTRMASASASAWFRSWSPYVRAPIARQGITAWCCSRTRSARTK